MDKIGGFFTDLANGDSEVRRQLKRISFEMVEKTRIYPVITIAEV